MKNKEKFIDKLADFACTRNNIAMNFKGELVGCYGLLCENCKFYTETDCKAASREWLEKEYIEPLKISKRDKTFLEYIGNEYEYIARDSNGSLFLYIDKPERNSKIWFSNSKAVNLKHFNVEFPMIKWEDSEPWLIEDLKQLEVIDSY